MDEDFLKHVYNHSLLSTEDLMKIGGAHEEVSYKKGEFVLKVGQLANDYLILKSGLMRSFVYDYNTNDITTDFFVDNELVIEVSSLFQRIPTRESIQTLTECVCLKISFENFQNLFHSIEGLREWGRGWLSNSLFEFKQRSISMLTDSATERYLSLTKTKPLVAQQAPLKHIASYLGITDSSLSRIRKETAKH